MRVILDTNVLISGIFFNGPPSEILDAWKSSLFQIVFSPQILEEYRNVAESLSNSYPGIGIRPIIDTILLHGEVVFVTERYDPICDDPDDDKFIECALAGNCTLIISGDKHLLRISGYSGITVLKPREFIDLHLKKS
jgi:uncharacterized protein